VISRLQPVQTILFLDILARYHQDIVILEKEKDEDW
jgi:hypothetical protein